MAEEEEDTNLNSNNNNWMIHAHPTIVKFLQCDMSKNDNQRPFHEETESQKIACSSIKDMCFPKALDAPLSCEDLVTLALQCDNLLYSTPSSSLSSNDIETAPASYLSPSTQSLIQLGAQNDPAVNAAATLLALNQLESAIRRRLRYTTGKAPLLKSMIVELAIQQPKNDDNDSYATTNTNLSFLLQGLLLPTSLNLRNMLWHGFCGGLPRPWLSLALCCTETLDADKNGPRSSGEISPSPPDVAIHEMVSSLAAEYTTKGGIREHVILEWLPASHHALWHLARQWLFLSSESDDGGGSGGAYYPVCSIAILSVLLEHGLRRAWCRANQRPEDSIAQPHQFYVTLDGHGQRHVHDLLLHPYLVAGGGMRRNALLHQQRLGGSVTALLTDLFCSAAGPNIRATLAHGLWDDYLEDELVRMRKIMEGDKPGASPPERVLNGKSTPHFLRDYAMAVLVAIEAAACACSDDSSVKTSTSTLAYQPRFSYTATTRQSLLNCQRALQELMRGKGNSDLKEVELKYDNSLPTFLAKLQVPWSWLDASLSDMIEQLSCGTISNPSASTTCAWTVDQVYQEHDLNELLAPLGATQQLARDVGEAVAKLHAELNEAEVALHPESDDNLSTRQRRRYARVLTLGTPGAIFYGFATIIVLLSLQDVVRGTPPRWDPKDSLKMVERSRMVVSTVSMHLTTNTERAYKSIDAYCKGKIIKQVFPLVEQLSI
eukprot:scaffold6364_cov171-Amphora_coffeaeformis.AAC.2